MLSSQQQNYYGVNLTPLFVILALFGVNRIIMVSTEKVSLDLLPTPRGVISILLDE